MPETKRLLWLTSTLMPAMAEHVGAPHAMAGPWIARLLEEVHTHLRCEICVAAPFRTAKPLAFSQQGIHYVILNRPRKWHYWNYSMDGLIDAGKLIDAYNPALIHVHGSEHCLGLAHQHASWQAPTVLSLQGILRAYAPRALGELDLWDVILEERFIDLCRMSGVVGIRRAWRKSAQMENVILNAHRHFIGHNSWDKAQLYAANPNAIYHHVGDPVRREFFNTAWHPSRYRRNTVFFGNLAGAHKGGHTIVRALPILARDFPEVHFRLAGRLGTKGGYGRLFLNEAARLGIANRVTFLGFLDATSMARELAQAHVFVSASHIDNNPSSVAEAQAVGTPIVASYVGGVPEMLDDGRAGLFFPAGDPEMLAYRLSQIFRSDALAESMSAAGRRQVDIRHNPKTIVGELAAAYAAAGCDLPKR